MVIHPVSIEHSHDRHDEPRRRAGYAPIIVTKLRVPPVPRDLVPREQLLAVLDAEPHPRVTLVSAPAGFGKTTLLAQWAQRAQAAASPIAWLALDHGDIDPPRFWRYAVAAYEASTPGMMEQANALLALADPPDEDYVISAIINDLATHSRTIGLVLDDYHMIDNPAIHRGVEMLVHHLPSNARIFFASREDPPIALGRLRACGDLREIRIGELRFSDDEAVAFVQTALGQQLDRATIELLCQRTEGWIAGLRLAVISAVDQPDPVAFFASFTGSHRSIVDYLVGEVLDRQPPDVLRFMLRTAILDRLSGPLCDAVTLPEPGRDRDGAAMLEWLERGNAFLIPLDHERRWFRYGSLFADVLLERLRRIEPEAEPTLHARAAVWLDKHDFTSEAIDHALTAGDTRHVAEIVARHSRPLLTRGELETIERWVSRLPEDIIVTSPMLCCIRAWASVLGGRIDDAEVALAHADRGAARSDDRTLRGEIITIRSHIARLRADLPEAVALCQQALELVPESLVSLRRAIMMNLGISLWWSYDAVGAEQAFAATAILARESNDPSGEVIAICYRARLLVEHGELRRSGEVFASAFELAESRGVAAVPALSFAHLGMAFLSEEQQEIATAHHHAHEAIRFALAGGRHDHIVMAYIALARLSLSEGKIDQATDFLNQAESLRQQHAIGYLHRSVEWAQVMLWIDNGELDRAADWADALLADVEGDLSRLDESRRIVLSRLRLEQGRPDDAWESLTVVHERSIRSGWALCIAEVEALRALIERARGHQAEALNILAAAIDIGAAEGVIRIFTMFGTPMRSLLTELRYRRNCNRPFVDRLLAAFPPERVQPNVPTPPLPRHSGDTLTPREREVLTAIEAGLSNREIADKLFLSVGTVKRHTNNIYAKLAVSSRTQALARARELCLLA